MLNAILSFALRQRGFIIVMTLALVGAGIFSVFRLPIDAFPEIAPTQVKLVLKAPGMTPQEVESQVVRPLEMELLGIPHQKVMRATAKYAIADITLDFEDGTDVYWARQQVSERLATIRSEFPATVDGGLAPISTALSELFMFTIDGGDLSLEERRTLLDWVIRPNLRNLPGVADVNALGGRVRTFEISPNAAALIETNLSVADLYSSLMENNRNDGAGRINEGEEALIVRTVGAATSLEEISSIVVKETENGVIRIGDVADVRIGALTRYGSVTRDGVGEAVEGIVVALKGADARQVVQRVEQRLEELRPGFPGGVEIKVFYNRSDLIDRAITTVVEALVIAAVLVVILLVAFLGDIRSALVVALSLPLAALATFILMRITGLSANLMSLGGLAIAIGMIVDSAIVVVENTVQRLNTLPHRSKLHLVYRSASEVALPTAAGVFIICLVFLPLLTLEGLEGKLFSPVALTIVFALTSALVLAFTFIPVAGALLLKPVADREPLLMRLIGPAFEKAFSYALRLPILVYSLAALGVGLAIIAYSLVGKTFMPTMNEGAVVMQLAALPSINLEQSQADDLRIEEVLIERVPEIKHMISRLGSDELGLDPMSLNESDVFLELAPRKYWRGPDTEWLVGEMRTVMDEFAGIESSFTQPIEMRVSEMLTGSRGDLAVKIFGPKADTLAALAGEIESLITPIDGAADVFTTSNDVSDYLQISINPQRAGRFGLDVLLVQQKLRSLMEGVHAGEIIEPARRTPILIRSAQERALSAEELSAYRFITPDGRTVHLGDIANIERVEDLASVDRENGSRYAVVEAFVSGRDLVSFVEDVDRVLTDQLDLPSGYRIELGGEFENQRRAAARLAIMIPLSLSLIFLVLFATLRSLRQSLLILFNIPFALVGGIIALFLSGEYLSVPASVGFIALLGIAVLNGLVLLTYFNDLRELGHDMDHVIRVGTARRLRPVLMTATTAAFGLIPLLFASGPGSEIQKPLAIVVIGGLISSTLLTLFLMPLLYRRFGTTHSEADKIKELTWVNPYAN